MVRFHRRTGRRGSTFGACDHPLRLRFWQRVGMAVKPDFGPKVDIYGMKCTEPIGGRDPCGKGADTTSICVGFFVLSKKLIAP